MSRELLLRPMFLLLWPGESFPEASALSVPASETRTLLVQAGVLRHLQQFGELLSGELLPPADDCVGDVGGDAFLPQPHFDAHSFVRVEAAGSAEGYSKGLPSVSWILFFGSRAEALMVTDRSRSTYSCSGSCLRSLLDLASGLLADFCGGAGSFGRAAAGTKSW